MHDTAVDPKDGFECALCDVVWQISDVDGVRDDVGKNRCCGSGGLPRADVLQREVVNRIPAKCLQKRVSRVEKEKEESGWKERRGVRLKQKMWSEVERNEGEGSIL